MRSIALAATAAATLLAFTAPLYAQGWQMPSESERCPSKWGAGDQRGTGNMMKPETVLQAMKLIKTGEVFELGAILSPDPKESFVNAGRQFNIYTKPSPVVPNGRQIQEELVVTELGQIGTQIDAFAHQMWGDSFYNCFKLGDIGTRSGFKKLGVENIGALFTRGVLIDVAALKGVEMLGDTYEITPEDLQQALARQGNIQPLPGDAIIIHTGWGKLYGKDNARFVKSTPGVGTRAAEWLVKQDPLLVGSDNWPVEVSPNPDKELSLPGHQIFLVVNGVHILENLKLDELAAKKVYEFAFTMQPLKIQGASGSTVAPAALR
jgi:kynurenine formamidase